MDINPKEVDPPVESVLRAYDEALKHPYDYDLEEVVGRWERLPEVLGYLPGVDSHEIEKLVTGSRADFPSESDDPAVLEAELRQALRLLELWGCIADHDCRPDLSLLLNRFRDLAGLDPDLTNEVTDPKTAKLVVRSILRRIDASEIKPSAPPAPASMEDSDDREVWITAKQAAEEAPRQTGEDFMKVYERARQKLRTWRNGLHPDVRELYCKEHGRERWLYRQDAIQRMINRGFRKRST